MDSTEKKQDGDFSLPGTESRDDLVLAQKIQAAMLPRIFPSFEGLELGSLVLPGNLPGGDLFDIRRLSDDILALTMITVPGSGVLPVMIAAMAKGCFSAHLHPSVSPATVVERVNNELALNFTTNLRLSAFMGYLDLHDNLLTYCNAGTVTPLVFRRETQAVDYLVSGTRLIEPAAPGAGGWEEHRVYLTQGDCLLLYSDGVHRRLDTPGIDTRSRITGIIRQQLAHEGCSSLLNEFRTVFNEKATPPEVDISLVYAEIQTQSRKDLLIERLGFTPGEIIYLQFLNYLEEMDQVTATLLAAMDVHGYPDERIRKMKIVLTELLVNAIMHGNNRDTAKRVVVGHTIDRYRMVISILDEGTGFNPKTIPDPTLPENLEKPCGRGLFIVRHYVDSIEFNETGNRVTVSLTGAYTV